MASDPNEIADIELEAVVDSDDDTVVDPDLEPYDESVEKPLKDSENFIPAEEL
ncbi:hypothetical protein ACFQ2T_08215 [Methylophilus flavus]|uniref:Uncharacterized protein n=1 Tax=Methylophilus flavus TaxID=640084 RepID=A0ABW3PAD1_9PROT